MWHPDEGTLHALLDGELDSTEVARVEAHLSDCADCRTTLREAREFRDVARTLVETLDETDDRLLAFASPAAPATSAAGRATDPEPVSIARTTPSTTPPVGLRQPRARWIAGLAWAATVVLAVSAGYLLAGRGNSPAAAARDLALTDSASLESMRATAPPPVPAAASPSDRPPPAPAPKAESASGPAATKRAPQKDLEPAADRAADSLRKAALERMKSAQYRLDELVVTRTSDSTRRPLAANRIQIRGALAPTPAAPAVDSALQAARAFLGDTLRAIDGLAPTRVEIVDSVVRVHYRTGGLAFVLEQWREGTALRTRVVAPEGTPPDSVAAWTRRIR